MVSFYCCICNERKDTPLNDISFLYNDENYKGLPCCSSCKVIAPKEKVDWLKKRLNKKWKKESEVKIGLEKWL